MLFVKKLLFLFCLVTIECMLLFLSRDTHPVPTWTSMKWSFLQLGHTHVLSQRTTVSKNIQSTLNQSLTQFHPQNNREFFIDWLDYYKCWHFSIVPSLVSHNLSNSTYVLSVNQCNASQILVKFRDTVNKRLLRLRRTLITWICILYSMVRVKAVSFFKNTCWWYVKLSRDRLSSSSPSTSSSRSIPVKLTTVFLSLFPSNGFAARLSKNYVCILCTFVDTDITFSSDFIMSSRIESETIPDPDSAQKSPLCQRICHIKKETTSIRQSIQNVGKKKKSPAVINENLSDSDCCQASCFLQLDPTSYYLCNIHPKRHGQAK